MGFDYRTSTGLGKQTLGGHKQKLVHTRSQEKGAVTPQETEPDLPVSVQKSPAEAWVDSGLMRGSGALNTRIHAQVLFKELTNTFTTPTIVWPQAKQQGENTALPINRKLD